MSISIFVADPQRISKTERKLSQRVKGLVSKVQSIGRSGWSERRWYTLGWWRERINYCINWVRYPQVHELAWPKDQSHTPWLSQIPIGNWHPKPRIDR